MMENLIRLCERLAPPARAVEGDNIGLIAGDPRAKVRGIVVALDLTAEALDLAERVNANLIIVHHSPIYFPIHKIDLSTPQGGLLARLLRQGVAVYAMHTNLDFAPRGLNDYVARLLGLRAVRPVSAPRKAVYRVGRLSTPMPPPVFARHVKGKLRLNSVRLAGAGRKAVSRVAVCTGAGADLVAHAAAAGADALVTGEARHHNALDCAALGICMVDAGHWGTERPMVDLVTGYLKKMMVKSGKRTRIFPLHSDEPFVSY